MITACLNISKMLLQILKKKSSDVLSNETDVR